MSNIIKSEIGVWWAEKGDGSCTLPVSDTPVIGLSSIDKLKIIEWLLLEEEDKGAIVAFLNRKHVMEGK